VVKQPQVLIALSACLAVLLGGTLWLALPFKKAPFITFLRRVKAWLGW
jgi:hypothetical protein